MKTTEIKLRARVAAERWSLIVGSKKYIGSSEPQHGLSGYEIDALTETIITAFKGKTETKPKPKVRPLRPEEVPARAFFKFKGCKEPLHQVEIHENRLYYLSDDGRIIYNQLQYGVFRCMDYSIDGGKTWKPCEVEI